MLYISSFPQTNDTSVINTLLLQKIWQVFVKVINVFKYYLIYRLQKDDANIPRSRNQSLDRNVILDLYLRLQRTVTFSSNFPKSLLVCNWSQILHILHFNSSQYYRSQPQAFERIILVSRLSGIQNQCTHCDNHSEHSLSEYKNSCWYIKHGKQMHPK